VTTLAVQSTGQSGSPVKVVKVLMTILVDDKTAESRVLEIGDTVPISVDVGDESTIGLRQQYRGDYPKSVTPARFSGPTPRLS